MSRRRERELAVELARALDGAERPSGDVAALVTVLERAVEPARFEVSSGDVERALTRVRPRLDRAPRPSRPVPRLAVAFGAVAAAAVAIVVFTFVRLPGTDVEAKALAALGGPRTLLQIRERIEPATRGAFPASTRTVWLDPAHGVARWVQLSGGRHVEDVLVEHGRMKRYLPGQRLLIVGSSCRAFASGCAELVDPVAFYRQALEAPGSARAKREGGVYRLTLPVQELPDAVRIEQVVTLDAKTYRPKLIEWREDGRPVSRIVIESIERLSSGALYQSFAFTVPDGTKIEQRTASGATIRKVGQVKLTLAQARRVDPPLLWLGPTFAYRKLSSIERIDWSTGSAYRIRYGSITLWNFTDVVPPAVLSARVSTPSKTVPLGGNVAHFYDTRYGQLAAELDRPGRSVTILAPTFSKIDVIGALSHLKRLR